jgi:hypothetical protein
VAKAIKERRVRLSAGINEFFVDDVSLLSFIPRHHSLFHFHFTPSLHTSLHTHLPYHFGCHQKYTLHLSVQSPGRSMFIFFLLISHGSSTGPFALTRGRVGISGGSSKCHYMTQQKGGSVESSSRSQASVQHVSSSHRLVTLTACLTFVSNERGTCKLKPS